MDAGIVGEFRVKGRGHGSSLPDGDRIGAFGGDDFDARADAGNFWGTDEDHFEWRLRLFVVESSLQKLAFADGAVELAPIDVAADADVDRPKAGLRGIFNFGRQQDRARAGAKGGLEAHELF